MQSNLNRKVSVNATKHIPLFPSRVPGGHIRVKEGRVHTFQLQNQQNQHAGCKPRRVQLPVAMQQ